MNIGRAWGEDNVIMMTQCRERLLQCTASYPCSTAYDYTYTSPYKGPYARIIFYWPTVYSRSGFAANIGPDSCVFI